MTTLSSTNRRRLIVLAAAGIGVLVFVLYWFQPHKLFIDERVDEAAPVAAPAATSAAETSSAQAPSPSASLTSGTPSASPSVASPDATTTSATATSGSDELARGEFASLDHDTKGVSRVLAVGGKNVLRLEDFETSNGPDLYLYLSAEAADGDEAKFDDDFVNLGRLKGNKGDQNYELPAGTDLAKFKSVVIWCDRFNSAFGAAPITNA